MYLKGSYDAAKKNIILYLLLVQVCMNLVDIMPRRQQAVIEVKGGPTKY
uniref:Uncharacterized protein n=1 Tax=Cyprinus carpio TaxID=7962 RepID=A0A8C1EGB8_CYPCA